MALIAAHLNAEVILVAIGIYSPWSPTSIPPPPPVSPSLICRTVSVDVKHHVYLLTLIPNTEKAGMRRESLERGRGCCPVESGATAPPWRPRLQQPWNNAYGI